MYSLEEDWGREWDHMIRYGGMKDAREGYYSYVCTLLIHSTMSLGPGLCDEGIPGTGYI